MHQIETLQSSPMIDPMNNQRRKIIPIGVIVVVILGLILSILTQPFASQRNLQPDPAGAQSASTSGQNDASASAQTLERGAEPQRKINITGGLAWIGQIVISFIALLSSIGELTGVKLRELFGSGKAKTNVEEFPFHVFQDYNSLLDHLFPDPKISLISDRKIKYLPQILTETDEAYQQRGLVLIRGRSKTGKTREACELLQRWWFLGPTVLVARGHVGLKPPFKIPANLPTRNLVLFFDDIDRYLGDSAALKKLEETIQFFQTICHDRGELHVIATARQEEEFWNKLNFSADQDLWKQFTLVQLEPLAPEKALDVINELAATAEIDIAPELAQSLAEKNDGTFLNLALAFRGWMSRGVKTLTAEDIRLFDGALKVSWHRRYEDLVTKHPELNPVYAAIDFLQTYNLPLRPVLIIEIAAEMSMRKSSLTVLGWFDRLQAWADRSPALNWYRTPKSRALGWVVITLVGIVFLYLSTYAFLRFVPGNIQDSFFEMLAGNFGVQMACLLPLWILLVPFAVYLVMNITRNLALRRNQKALDFLLTSEVPMRESELRPYENQFEGNGSTHNWELCCYGGRSQAGKFTQRLTSSYLALAEQLRLSGEVNSARTLASVALKIMPENPDVLFLLGKIAFDEENYAMAIEHFKASQSGYLRSNNACHHLERLALSYLYLNEYSQAETTAQKALQGMPGLLTARWVLGLAQKKQGKALDGAKNIRQAAARQPMPIDIHKVVEAADLTEDLDHPVPSATDAPLAAHTPVVRKRLLGGKSVRWGMAALSAVLGITVAFIIFVTYMSIQFERNETTLRLTNALLTIFPGSPSITLQRGSAYYWLDENEKAIADCSEAIRIDPTYIQAYVERATVYEWLDEYEKAIADYDVVIRIVPQHFRAHLGRGEIYFSMGEHEKAFADYEEAIRINPESAWAYNTRGIAYRQLGEFDKAIEDYSTAMRIDPTYKHAPYNRGIVYQDLQAYEQAITDYNTAIRIDSGFAFAYNNRGNIYKDLNEYERAIKDYNEAIRIDPIDAVYYNNRGFAYYSLGEFEKSLLDYHQAIRINPRYLNAYIGRGDTYFSMGEHEKAFADYAEAIRIHPDSAWIYNTRGIAYKNLGEFKKAIADYSTAIRVDPMYAYAYFNRALIYRDLKDNDQAITDFSAAIRIDPTDPDYYINRGNAYQQLGENELAVADYDEAIRIDPKSANAYNTRGNVYKANGEIEKAIADYSSAIRVDPEYAYAYYNRALIYQDSKDYDKAIADYSAAIRIDPTDPDYYSNRGNIYDARGERKKAISDYTESIRLSPVDLYRCSYGYTSYQIACYNIAIHNNPQNADALYFRGEVYFRGGEYENAIRDLSDAIKIDSQNAAAFTYRGRAFFKLGEYKKAIEDYDQAIRIDPLYADPHNWRSKANKALGNEQEAATDLKKYQQLK